MKTLRILIADDHAVVRAGLRALLGSHPGWRVVGEAVTGRETVEQALRLKPDVAVIDFSMPELNGLETTRRIRKARPGTEVLLLTMHDSERLAHQALQAGARGFLLKSDGNPQIVAAVKALAQHRPCFTPKVSAMVLEGFLHPGRRPAGGGGPADRLSPREREIVQMIAEGHTSKAIAARLHVSEKTVDAHRGNILRKLDVHSAVDLVRFAIRNKIVEA
jgi:DNA-binding NarL/FixJ family response regulator